MSVDTRVDELLKLMTFEEKITLLYGHTNFTTAPIKRLGIPEFGMTDGPHGVGPHSSNKLKNVYFPAAIGLAASWDPNLAKRYGEVLAEETRAAGRHSILAPGINIHRSPLCGRVFEYMSEDPYLIQQMVVPQIQGIQSRRIAACVKHFICNNQDTRRKYSNSIVDERTLQEIYYPGFKSAVENGKPWMLMGSYNLLNGKYVYEDYDLLNTLLMKNWGFEGFVVSDWDATHALRKPEDCIKAGLSLEMPKSIVYEKDLVINAYNEGKFTDVELDEVIRRLLWVMFQVGLFDPENSIPKGSRNTEEHKNAAIKVIEEGSVLLKNREKVLPIDLSKVKRIAILGPFANKKKLPIPLGGSSNVDPPEWITVTDAFKELLNPSVEIIKDVKSADVVILVTGISHMPKNDCESFDRTRLELSKRKIKQIKSVAAKNPNTIVVLYNGSPVAMSNWIDDVAAVLEVWQPHEYAGYGIFNLLTGKVNPSGKLPTTFPKKLIDSPAHNPKAENSTWVPMKESIFNTLRHENALFGKRKPIKVHYDEGIFVGYRHFEKHGIEPLFPFGYGLSYTEFEYNNLVLSSEVIKKDESVTVSFDLKNIGNIAGAEIAQVYVKDIESSAERPVKELKGFKKIYLEPGESKTIKVELNFESFAFYSIKEHKWIVESGEFEILVGKSSKDILLSKKLVIS